MNPNKVTLSGEPPDDDQHGSAPGPVDQTTGQHTDYWILSDEERAKGFVRPVRSAYVHVGPKPPNYGLLRDLTEEEKERHGKYGYVKYEPYPEPGGGSVSGQFWTQDRLDRVGKCGTVTAMPLKIAETYARDPGFYGQTFCCGCREHLGVEEFIWDDGSGERVGT